ncbi:hypothetical protein OQA88_10893 [Cercophora sp. LCS_1]
MATNAAAITALQQQDTPNGYKELAGYIEDSPENAAFQSFKDLYVENLLYQQAEIKVLAGELDGIQQLDRAQPPPRGHYHRDWRRLRESVERGGHGQTGGHDGTQLRKIRQLRTALDEYCTSQHFKYLGDLGNVDESLFRYEKVLKMGHPHRRTLASMFEWIKRPSLGNAMILSDDWCIFERRDARAMVSLDSSTTDSLTSWVQYHAVDLYNRLAGRLIHTPNTAPHLRNTITYQAETIAQIARLISVAVACALPTGSIFILHWIMDPAIRLGIIFAMSVIFAVCMALMTPAKTHEIFGASSTFAAVLVVFISTDTPAGES